MFLYIIINLPLPGIRTQPPPTPPSSSNLKHSDHEDQIKYIWNVCHKNHNYPRYGAQLWWVQKRWSGFLFLNFCKENREECLIILIITECLLCICVICTERVVFFLLQGNFLIRLGGLILVESRRNYSNNFLSITTLLTGVRNLPIISGLAHWAAWVWKWPHAFWKDIGKW